ncbi:ABC transporter substrate-binding protein [Acidisphaera sp. L21]|uniref:ABC transporter substrate-binding protein n=1 Tax=Acidisphaera sp. L21 TaxID=1641851 RepID=UPI00131C9E8B|nr:ABC transporter substrate-binding protein [Acidisphaera sp. L21]
MVRTTGMLVAAMAALAALPASAAGLTTVQIASASASVSYISPYIALAKGYYKDAGLDVSIANFQSGSKAVEAMMGGSVDAIAGAYSNGILMAAKGQKVETFVNFLRCPGYVLAVGKGHDAVKGVADLKGMTIGVTAPGSSTHQALSYLFVKAGLKGDDFIPVGIGNTAGAVAAVQYGKVDAMLGVDPTVTILERAGNARTIVDLRSVDSSRAAVGGAYPEGSLLARTDYVTKHPAVIQGLTDAVVRANQWIAKSTPAEIVAALPPEIVGTDTALFADNIAKMKTCYSPDGVLPVDGPKTVLEILKTSDPTLGSNPIDLAATFTNAFTDKSPKG